MANILFEKPGGKYKRQTEYIPADIDRQAQERLERLIQGMKQAQGITE